MKKGQAIMLSANAKCLTHKGDVRFFRKQVGVNNYAMDLCYIETSNVELKSERRLLPNILCGTMRA